MKRLAWDVARRRPPEWHGRYLNERLHFLERFVEPLTGAAKDGGLPTFTELCRSLARAAGPNEVALRVGLGMVEEFGPRTWLDWAFRSPLGPTASLFCTAGFWASPFLDELPARWFGVSVTLASASLDLLDRPALAVGASETWLGLTPADYAGRDRLHAALAASRLADLDDPTHQAGYLVNLASPLRLVNGRSAGEGVELLEVWLGLSPNDYRSRDLLRAALGRSRLEAIEGHGTRASVVRELAAGLDLTPGRGPRDGAALLEAWLGLSDSDYACHPSLASALRRTPLRRVAERQTQATVISCLAGALMYLDGRGPPHASTLIEAWLGLSPADYLEAGAAAEVLRGRVASEIDIDAWADLLVSLADALRFTPGRGPSQAAFVIESWLDLSEKAYEKPNALKRVLAESELTQVVSVTNRAHVVTSLAESLQGDGRRGESQAASVLEAWLGLSDAAYRSRTAVARALARSPLREVESPLPWATVLACLGDVMRHCGRADQAVELLETWLGLRPTDYVSESSLRNRLSRSPLAHLTDSLSWANVITALGEALRLTPGRGAVHALALIEAWLGSPPPLISTDARFQDLAAVDRLRVAQAWLRAAGPFHPNSPRTCESVVDYFRAVRDEALGTFVHRQEFVGRARGVWADIQFASLSRSGQARRAGDSAAAEGVERQLLMWAEEFENRILLERMIEPQVRPSVAAPELLRGWRAGSWPFRHAVAPSRHSFRGGYLPAAVPTDASTGVLAKSRPGAVGAASTVTPEPGREAVGDPAAHRVRRLRQLTAVPPDLGALLPKRAVWIRSLFAGDGSLHWWALRRSGRGISLLSHGVSRPEARRRLEVATAEFDGTVDRIWAAHRSNGVSIRARQWLHALTALASDATYAKEQLRKPSARRAVAEEVAGALAELRSCDATQELANLGDVLLRAALKGPGGGHPADAMALGRWREGLRRMDSGEGREELRRRSLDEATVRLVEVARGELDIAPLSGAARIPWGRTDVLFQVQGPLLAVPLAWLDFGGRPLFRRVASTGSVLSLTLRHLAERERALAGKPPRRLLSAHWLSPDDWKWMRGLAGLHAGLQGVGRLWDWEVWGLGDTPEASLPRLTTALARRGRPFGAAVVGGHGSEATGVALADGVWRGGGCDLSSLDLIVLASCAVGRLRQGHGRDVEGLYTQLVAHGARSVVAARWPVSDVETATLVTEFINGYCESIATGDGAEPFARARALNRSWRSLLGEPGGSPYGVSLNVAASFDVYGLG